MQTLMYAVGTPVPGQTTRRACVFFRPRQAQDRSYFKIVYGGGCSAIVRNHSYFQRCFRLIIRPSFRLDTTLIMFQR